MTKRTRKLLGVGPALLLVLGCGSQTETLQPTERVHEDRAPVSAGAILNLYIDEYFVTYDDPGSFLLGVLFENVGEEPVVILPSQIRRQYRPLDTATITYVPYPGPRSPPWEGAFTLQPKETHRLMVGGMRDGDGMWDLEPGAYRLSLRYLVTDETASYVSPVLDKKPSVWVGEVQSSEITVRFEPEDKLGSSEKEKSGSLWIY